jgi:hypothetical protein
MTSNHFALVQSSHVSQFPQRMRLCVGWVWVGDIDVMAVVRSSAGAGDDGGAGQDGFHGSGDSQRLNGFIGKAHVDGGMHKLSECTKVGFLFSSSLINHLFNGRFAAENGSAIQSVEVLHQLSGVDAFHQAPNECGVCVAERHGSAGDDLLGHDSSGLSGGGLGTAGLSQLGPDCLPVTSHFLAGNLTLGSVLDSYAVGGGDGSLAANPLVDKTWCGRNGLSQCNLRVLLGVVFEVHASNIALLNLKCKHC